MTSPLRHALLLMLWLLVAPQPLLAAAWTRAPGSVFLSLTTSRYNPQAADVTPDTKLSVFAEAGVLPWLTLGGSIETKADRREGIGGISMANSGAIFARMRLREGPAGDPFSVQVGVIAPLTRPDPATGIRAEERAIDGRLLYGRGFATGWGDAFVNAEGGLRLLREGGADELRVDLTAGLRPLPRVLVMAQAFSVLGLRNNDPGGSDYDSLKLAPSLGLDLGPATVLVGAERTVTGRNIDRGVRFTLSLWRSF